MPEPEQLLDVLSVLDAQDNPVLNNCTLQMGEVALEFKNGRSKVPARLAAEVSRHPQILIPGYDGPVAAAPPNVSAELADAGERERQPETEEQRAARVAAAAEYLRSEGIEVPDVEEPGAEPLEPSEKEALEARIAELEQMVADAHPLPGADGEKDEDPEPDGAGEAKAEDAKVEVPKGFETETVDGKPRCLARKADGSQCSNPAAEGSNACKLPAHQKLVK